MKLHHLIVFAIVLAVVTPLRAQERPPHKNSAAYEWLDIALEATAREHERNAPRPTIGSRMLAIVVTAMYDAWAAYDDKAVGTRLGGTLRRPPTERTVANKATAIGYATYRAMLYLFPEDKDWIAGQMRDHGLDPDTATTDPKTPAGVGNAAAAAVIAYRRHDGANQHGDEVGSVGKPYSDYTYYRCLNTQDKVHDPDCWQPIEFDDGKGGKVTPGFLTPHWYRVTPFALERSDQFRPGPPPKVGSPQLKKEVDEVLKFNSSLTVEQKAIVEFMRDGPRSTGQSGHWLRFAQDVSRRDHHTIDQDVKIFFAVGNCAFDAFIACWDAKRYYDSSRPWTLVRHLYAGKKVQGWAGAGKGVVELPAEDWHPYSPLTFITPPFPGYPSGHSTVSGACAKMLELFTGSDQFGETEKRTAGALTEPGFGCKVIQMHLGKTPQGTPLTCDVALKMPTFSAAAEMAGISRVMGGYHIQSDNVEGLALGRRVAQSIWPKTKAYFDGTATVR
ncbi:MAG: vanadium-dependent haloperoxidase [Gemmataceae bacterium]